ncbi:mersacidin/lichenicidin family type 2 lantibiotic [Thalassomonas actiniarum]|uniref:Mersacidin/lichenicidin family type 2 lantibiotic n=1 Tax=Thalassomonas actiniarum TaxID=485447 RepID=A0AAE9YXC2_9GAMM|nr:mersacidin/lichenicidin family type 2 lantibiotic [Thalassomonas actiniarum]WDE02287.1 mersacidin/lichenicidin family type 2 lantibiotic [Thalassomonas actiniarum]
MSVSQIIKTWKDPAYRRSLSQGQLEKTPGHPAASNELDQEVIDGNPEALTMNGSAICSPCPPRHCL